MNTKPAEQIITKVINGNLSVVDGAVNLTNAYPSLTLNDAGLIVGEAYYGDATYTDTIRTATATLRDTLN